jgi:preprotein translocase subunit SecE
MAKETASKMVDNIKWFTALAVFSAAVIGNSYFLEVAFSV